MIPLRYLFPLLFLLLLSGCLKPVHKLYPEEKRERPVPAFVIELGWHAGLAFKARHLKSAVTNHEQLPDTDYFLVGWGDDKYYPSENPRVDLFLRAAFLPTGSVIQVIGIEGQVFDYFPDRKIVRVRLSKEGVKKMSRHIAKQFQTNDRGELQYVGDGHFPRSAFFKARGLYYFPRTSNRWTAHALRESGFPITPFYAITSGNVISQARKSGTIIQ